MKHLLAALCMLWAANALSGPVAGSSPYSDTTERMIGTATVYADGAEIKAHMTRDFAISPLELKISPKPPYPIAGDRVSITVSVSNSGSVSVERLSVALEIISGSIYISSLSGPSPSGMSRIAPGSAESFSWTADIKNTGPIRIQAIAAGVLAGQNVPVSGRTTQDLTSLTIAQLTAELTPNPMEVTGGKWFTLTITVSNTGGLPVMGITPDLEPTSGADLVTFKEGPVPKKPVSLNPGASQEFLFTFSANGSGIVSFSTTVQGQAELDPPGLVARASSNVAAKTRSAWRASTKTASRWFKKAWHLVSPPAPPLPAEKLFMGFESKEDLAWDTGGYVELDGSSKHATEGTMSCRAAFLLPDAISLAPEDGSFQPTFRRTYPPRGTLPPLEPRDWSAFESFRADCYNAGKEVVDLRIILVDKRGFEFEALRRLPSAAATTIEVSVADTRESMLNTDDISEFRISVDTAVLKEKPVIFFDNFRFALPPPSMSSTISLSSTAFPQSGGP